MLDMNLIVMALMAVLSGNWHTLTDADVIYRIMPVGPVPSETLILATSGGVVYFDLASMEATEIYTNTEGLLGVIVKDIERDANGYLWALASGKGLSFKNEDDDHFTPYPPSMFPPSTDATDLEPLPDGRLAIATTSGLFVLDTRGTYDNFSDDFSMEISRRRGFPFDTDSVVSIDLFNDTLYMATPSSVYFANIDSITYFDGWHTVNLSGTGLEGNELTLVFRSEHYFVIGSDRGMFIQTPDTSFPFLTGSDHWTRLNDCYEGSDGALYIASYRRSWAYPNDGGVWRITRDGWATPLSFWAGSYNFTWGRFATAVFDNGGQLIAGFGYSIQPDFTKFGAGIAVYDTMTGMWTNHHIGKLWFNAPAFVLAHGDVVWLLMRDGSKYPVYIQGIAGDTVYVQNPMGLLRGVFAYAVDHKGFVWAGTTSDGIFVFDSTANFVAQLYVTSYPIIDMAFSNGDTLYMCISQFGIHKVWYVFDGDSLTGYGSDPVDLQVTNPVDIDIDGQNRLWIGTQGTGVKVLDLKTGDSFWLTESNGLPTNYINMLKADGDGVWVCTKNGLAYYEGNEPPRIYLQGEDVSAVAPAADGRLWVVTSDRVLVLRPESGFIESQFVAGPYSMPETPNPAYKTEVIAVRSEIGDVWVATSNGVGVFEPDAMDTYNQLEHPYIYPNPYLSTYQSSYITIVDVDPDAEIAVFDVAGQRLDLDVLKRGTEAFVKVKDLPPGLYIVVIKSGDVVKRLKFAVR